MYISMNWIKDFVDLDGIDLMELINRFTLSTAEVEEIQKYGYDTTGVVVGKILSVEKHPQSEKLKKLLVDIGNKQIQSLCGASNVEEGQLIVIAPAGSIVKGVEVKAGEIAGEKSEGVCLSEKELGISDDHSGIMVLTNENIGKEITIGKDIKDIIPLEDIVFGVDNKSLTNRPDLWGHYGIAREISALTGRKLKELDVEDVEKYKELPKLGIAVQDKERCYRYSAIALENISKKISNIDMRVRLYYAGSRAINLLADITNYVMLELGQPMHAFDKRYVDHVNICTVPEQNFKTLDGVERKIYDDTLMICKDDEPVCIAGIMGGEDTEIKDDTSSLFLESATFDSVSVRKSAIKIGLRTDASARYEKSLDPELTVPAIARYIYLLKQNDNDAKVVSSLTDEYVKKYEKINIEITQEYISKLMGISIEQNRICEILVSLGFKVNVEGENIKVEVPSFRATKDVSIKADLLEEVSRIYGFGNIPPKTKKGNIEIVKLSQSQLTDRKIKDMLAIKYNLSEVHSYVWYDKKINNELKIKTQNNIKIINSLNADNNVLRSSMIPSLLNALVKNVKNYPEIGIFEIGKVFEYPEEGKDCKEIKKLGIALSSKEMDEIHLLARLHEIVNNIAIENKNKEVTIKETKLENMSWTNLVNCGKIECNEKNIGYISVLNPIIKQIIDKKINVVIAEIDLAEFDLIKCEVKKFEEPLKYQTTEIDLSLIVDKAEKFEKIKSVIEQNRNENILNYSLVGIYENAEKLGDKKSVTIKFTLGSATHTLVSDEISKVLEELINSFEKAGMVIRK